MKSQRARCRRQVFPTAGTPLRFPRRWESSSGRKSRGGGVTGSCCQRWEWLGLLSAPSGVEVEGCSPGMPWGWDAGSFAAGAGGPGGTGEDRLCCRAAPDVSAPSGERCLGARRGSPSRAGVDARSPLASGSPPASPAAWQTLPRLPGWEGGGGTPHISWERARIGLPAAGEAAAEGATLVWDRGQSPGKTSLEMSKAIPCSAVTTRPSGPCQHPPSPLLLFVVSLSPSEPCLLCQQAYLQHRSPPGLLSGASFPRLVTTCHSGLFRSGRGTCSHFFSAARSCSSRAPGFTRKHLPDACRQLSGDGEPRGTLLRGCVCPGGCSRGRGERPWPPGTDPSTAPASCFPLLLPGIYCFHFPWRWKPSLITDIFMCINNLCGAASQGEGSEDLCSGGSWGAAGARQLSQPPQHSLPWEYRQGRGLPRLGDGSPDPRGVSSVWWGWSLPKGRRESWVLAPGSTGGYCWSQLSSSSGGQSPGAAARLLGAASPAPRGCSPGWWRGKRTPMQFLGRARPSAEELQLQAPTLGKSPRDPSPSPSERDALAQHHQRCWAGFPCRGSPGDVPPFSPLHPGARGCRHGHPRCLQTDRAHVSLSFTLWFLWGTPRRIRGCKEQC